MCTVLGPSIVIDNNIWCRLGCVSRARGGATTDGVTVVSVGGGGSGGSLTPCVKLFARVSTFHLLFKKNLNASRPPSEHPPVRGGKCQNV